MNRFRCRQCGECCSHIRGMIPREDRDFLNEYAYGRLPLVSLFPIEKMSFPLFDFEAKRFKAWAKEAGVDAKILPSRVVYDLKTDSAIVFTYYMDYDSCPFLKEKKCMLYDKKRAFICRLFPFNKGPFLDTGDRIKKEDMFGSCKPALDLVSGLDDSDKKTFLRQLNEAFSSDFLNMVEFDYIMGWINRLIISLMKSDVIKPAMNYPYKFLLKRIDNSRKVDLMDFLVENKVNSRQEIETLINAFETYIHAEELLANDLG